MEGRGKKKGRKGGGELTLRCEDGNLGTLDLAFHTAQPSSKGAAGKGGKKKGGGSTQAGRRQHEINYSCTVHYK